MSKTEEGRSCEEKKTRAISRSEFLGAGATMAAAATLGATRALPAESATRLPEAQTPALTCPPSTDDWAISATMLHYLWADVWPRLVAEVWRPPQRWFNEPSDLGVNIVPRIRSYLNGVPGSAARQEYKDRAAALNEYLGRPRRIPIRLMGRGYDFLLSDAGLDLFAPDAPDREEMVRYYAYRQTGRAALGLPEYSSPTTVITDAPTGPSQASINFNQTGGIVVSSEALGCTLGTIQCWQEYARRDRARPVRPGGVGRGGGPPLATPQQPPEGQVFLDLETFACFVDECRCWQISGAVYRGIGVELPRIVANMWYEETTGADGAATSYSARFRATVDPSTGAPTPMGNVGIREIFGERLETSLPEMHEMHCAVHPAAIPNAQLATIWQADDIMITNRGFYIPAASAAAPGLIPMLDEIAAGNAGNPVFTDSRRTL